LTTVDLCLQQSLLNFERKIDGIEVDIRKNQEVIDQIRAAVREVSKNGGENIDKLQVSGFTNLHRI